MKNLKIVEIENSFLIGFDIKSKSTSKTIQGIYIPRRKKDNTLVGGACAVKKEGKVYMTFLQKHETKNILIGSNSLTLMTDEQVEQFKKRMTYIKRQHTMK